MVPSIEGQSARQFGLTPLAGSDAVVGVNLLGSFEVCTRRGPVPDALWRSARARALFKYLAYRAGTPISRNTLLDTLWPDVDAETGQNTLHKAVHLLRQTIEVALDLGGKELLEFSDGCYLMRAGELCVDALEFKRALFDAKWCERLDDHEGSRRHYEVVVALYRGDLLEDDYLVEWAVPERERLRADYTASLRRLAHMSKDTNPDRSAYFLRRLLAADSCAEDAYRALIEIALQAGRRGEALRLYRQCKETLWRELALGTSAELDRLILQV